MVGFIQIIISLIIFLIVLIPIALIYSALIALIPAIVIWGFFDVGWWQAWGISTAAVAFINALIAPKKD